MQTTVTISIGRRRGTGANLTAEDWRKFRAGVEGAVVDLGGEVFFAGQGGGIYGGTFEESATWVAGTDEAEDTVAWRVFVRTLAGLAARFGQDSIAVTRGETAFVAATSPATKAA